MIKFYDTCSLLLKGSGIFEKEKDFYISSITLKELENIKTSANKDPETKYEARELLRVLDKNTDKYSTIIYTQSMGDVITQQDLELTNDTKILACAIHAFEGYKPEEVTFVTNDLALKQIARTFVFNVTSVDEEDKDEYTGYKEIVLNDEELAELYSNRDNKYNLLINQYLIVYNKDNEFVDVFCWTGEILRNLKFKEFYSAQFGRVKPMAGDIYQRLAFDCLSNNQISVIRGKAGSGKSLLGLAYLFQQLEKGKIDKIIMFVNPVATKDSCKFGFLPGTALEKILGSQIGHFLSSKLGDVTEVERLVGEGKLILLPVADSRGYDTTGMNAGIYITEAQNTTIEIMKLLLQRVGEDSICVIEGDDMTQVDMYNYEGNNNGLKRLSKIFKGQNYYGEVTLNNCYRSKIADRAELM